jgi:hypothetical protein
VTDRKQSPLDRALDLFFFAPLGFVLNADEIIPQLVEKGRQQIPMARMFGQFAVQQGQTEAAKAAGRVQEQAAGVIDQLTGLAGGRPTTAKPTTRATTATRPSPARASEPVSSAASPSTMTAEPAAPPAPTGPRPDPSALAIPDYDSLSASQVVPRLAGLSAAELEAVRAYESANRGRKTILHRVAQLQAS